MALTPVRFLFALMVLLASSLLCSSCGQHKTTKPLPTAQLEPYRGCQQDDECTWVNNGCCDCANGGEDIAVAKSKKDAFRALFSCDNTPCSAVMGECGTGTAACEAGQCVFRPVK